MISDRSQNVLRFLLLLLFFYKTYHWLSQDTVIFEKKKVVQDFGFFIKCLIFLYLSLSLSISLYLSLSLSQKKLYNTMLFLSHLLYTQHYIYCTTSNLLYTKHPNHCTLTSHLLCKKPHLLYTDITFIEHKISHLLNTDITLSVHRKHHI